MEADLKARHSGSKERIMSTNPAFRDSKKRTLLSTKYQENDTMYFITHDHGAENKKKILDSISDVLGAGLKVRVLE